MNKHSYFPLFAAAILLIAAGPLAAQDTVFFTGFEGYDPVVFFPTDLNGADDQIGEWSGEEEFPEGQGDIIQPDSVAMVPSPYGGLLMVLDRPMGDFDDNDVTGSYFADFSMPVGLLGAEVSFDVGTRRTGGNNAKDYDIIGRDSAGEETFHLRVGTNNNGGERLGVVTEGGATVTFDLPTSVGDDGPADLDNMGGFTRADGPGFGAEIANVLVRTGADGFIVDFSYPEESTSGNANAYTTSLLPYSGSGTDLVQLEFTYEGSTNNGFNSGYVLDNITATGFQDLLQGDFNFDGSIDFADYTILNENFGTGTTFGEGDFDFDGVVGLADFIGLKAAFDAKAGATAAAVPEPGSLTLLGIAGLALLLKRRRRRFV